MDSSSVPSQQGNDSSSLPSASDAWLMWTFHYHPNEAFAFAAAGSFAVLTFVILVLNHVYCPKAKFMRILVATGVVEVLGYLVRVATERELSMTGFVTSALFLLLPPIALALVNYLVVARLTHHVNMPVHVLCITLSPNQIAKFFLASDICCFFLQAGGGSLLAISNETISNIGTGVVLFGLSVQLIFYSCFCAITVTIATKDTYLLKFAPALRPVWAALAITSFFLYTRNCYRVYEFAIVTHSTAPAEEWPFMAFEFAPIIASFAVYAGLHFGKFLISHSSDSTEPLWVTQVELARAQHQACLAVEPPSIPETGSVKKIGFEA